jgi:hypothetical protein
MGYCYYHIINQELQDFKEDWNSHRIRKTHGARCPGGVPNDLFHLPQITGIIMLAALATW